MSKLLTGVSISKEVLDKFSEMGLPKNCNQIDIHISTNEPIEVTARFYPTTEDGKILNFDLETKKFGLVWLNDPENILF